MQLLSNWNVSVRRELDSCRNRVDCKFFTLFVVVALVVFFSFCKQTENAQQSHRARRDNLFMFGLFAKCRRLPAASISSCRAYESAFFPRGLARGEFSFKRFYGISSGHENAKRIQVAKLQQAND